MAEKIDKKGKPRGNLVKDIFEKPKIDEAKVSTIFTHSKPPPSPPQPAQKTTAGEQVPYPRTHWLP